MKRLHVSIKVRDVAESVRFYSVLFDAAPDVREDDYAKWMLDDPRVNFAVSTHGSQSGVDHFGIQVDDDAELAATADRLARAGRSVHEQKAITCCYARSNKAWVHDPDGVAWETFHTFGDSDVYGEDLNFDEVGAGEPGASATACCAPGR